MRTKPIRGILPNKLHPLSPNAAWIMNEGSGNKIFDIIESNHGTFGIGTAAPNWMPGRIGSALYFNGDDIITSSYKMTSSANGAFTIIAWFKTTHDYSASWAALVGVEHDSDNIVDLNIGDFGSGGIGGNNKPWIYFKASGEYRFANSNLENLNDDQWHCIVGGRRTNGDSFISADGESIVIGTNTTNDISGTRDLGIGTVNAATPYSYFHGTIDGVQIYDFAAGQYLCNQFYYNPYFYWFEDDVILKLKGLEYTESLMINLQTSEIRKRN